jgi:hypothetical protein
LQVILIDKLNGTAVGSIELLSAENIFRYFNIQLNGIRLERVFDSKFSSNIYQIKERNEVIFSTVSKSRAMIEFAVLVK